MTATIKTVKLDQLGFFVGDYVDESPDLDPSACDPLPVVAPAAKGTLDLIDGFHRVAGMVRWCRENGVSPETCEINVVLCDDDELAIAAAEPGPRQEEALEAIHAAAHGNMVPSRLWKAAKQVRRIFGEAEVEPEGDAGDLVRVDIDSWPDAIIYRAGVLAEVLAGFPTGHGKTADGDAEICAALENAGAVVSFA